METRAPMKRGQDSSKEGQEMDLPDGKTCADCAHCRRCCMMFGHIPEDEVCDWHPSRFRPVTPNLLLSANQSDNPITDVKDRK